MIWQIELVVLLMVIICGIGAITDQRVIGNGPEALGRSEIPDGLEDRCLPLTVGANENVDSLIWLELKRLVASNIAEFEPGEMHVALKANGHQQVPEVLACSTVDEARLEGIRGLDHDMLVVDSGDARGRAVLIAVGAVGVLCSLAGIAHGRTRSRRDPSE